MEIAIVISDSQRPYHDQRALDVVYKYIMDIKPDHIIVLGDWLDFAQLTTKFLRRAAAPDQLMKDIEAASNELVGLSKYTKELTYIEGNHEVRMANYILERAPDLQGLSDGGPLDIERLLAVPGMRYVGPYGEAWVHNSFVFKHGDFATTYAARKELEFEGSSGMSGHTHRFQTHMRTDRSGAHAWYSIGCLCNIKGPNMPPGARRHADWQQGFALVRWDAKVFNVYPVTITDGRFISPEGRLYK